MKARPAATRDHHAAKRLAPPLHPGEGLGEGLGQGTLQLPRDAEDIELRLSNRSVRLTNLKKLFWPELSLTKRDLLQYYADVAEVLPRREFRDDAPPLAMNGRLRGDHIRSNRPGSRRVAGLLDDGGRRLVARGLDSQNAH